MNSIEDRRLTRLYLSRIFCWLHFCNWNHKKKNEKKKVYIHKVFKQSITAASVWYSLNANALRYLGKFKTI